MNDTYKTIQSKSEGLYKEKGSRFIALAYPMSSEEAIKGEIAELRKRFHDARHHCFAWRLGADSERYRVSDDGEPSGSAGKPIFGQIQSRELTNVLVVVIRYFGGTLLGVGGLINAYRSAASNALEKSGIIEMRVNSQLKLKFGYLQMNSVMKVIKDFQLEFENQEFDLDCSLTLKVWKRNEIQVVKKLSIIEGCTVEHDI
ncbi:MAG: YigZ family protein [Bacteroidota bacterium]